MEKSLAGKVAIVTGSGQGIGKGIAIYLAREGAKVMTNNRKPNGESAQKYHKEDMPEEDWKEFIQLKGDAGMTAEIINQEGGEALPFYGDVSDWDTAERMVQTAIDKWGRIDILINNAAGLGKGSLLDLTEDDWNYLTVSRNKGAFQLMHFAIPHMIKEGFGRIINISSDAWVGLADNDAYSCSTAGMVGLTWASAKELYRHGITVNAFCPQGASPAHAVEYKKMVRNVEKITGKAPDPKILAMVEADHADPIRLGPITAFICTEDAAYISGSVFSVTAAGKISLYSNPKQVKQIWKKESLWTVDELKKAMKEELLGTEYISDASKNSWS
ncbi:MAG TPA: SDR family NAD(P)-dependent oxidoreductase [Clostridiales bacterium]|nr:SDR family NAD(P)-dependent oxidoreductase [Clostridiales bacterium]